VPVSEPPKSERARRKAALVTLGATGVLVPAGCACCGEPAARSAVARGPGGAELIVGYCDACVGHLGRESVRKLAATVASALVGLGLALALPLARYPLPLPALSLLVFFAALAPLLVVLAWPRRPEPGHGAEGPAVRFVGEQRVLCANDRFATELARANAAKIEHVEFRELRLARRVFALPLLAVLVAVATLLLCSPLVRIVNLGPERIAVTVDGRRVATVDPTSVEAPAAGAEVRVTAGVHELTAASAERVVARELVTVESGHMHLFAPGSDGYCFWLETAEYGRGRPPGVTRTPLEGSSRFWVLPAELGGFFRPVPEQAQAEARLTGGVVTVLRQAPCGADP
jgi:hypothetical protein